MLEVKIDAATPWQTKVYYNGIDLSHIVKAIEVNHYAGESPEVLLTVIAESVSISVPNDMVRITTEIK